MKVSRPEVLKMVMAMLYTKSCLCSSWNLYVLDTKGFCTLSIFSGSGNSR